MSYTLKAGRNKLKASELVGSGAPSAHTLLKFEFSFLDAFDGVEARVQIVHGSVVIDTFEPARYGVSQLEFRIQDLNPAHEIFLDLNILTVPVSFALNQNHVSQSVAQLDFKGAEIIEDAIGARGYLAYGARDIAERLGLRNVYMKDERAERFTARILNALTEKRPYGVIRLGDGEGRLLGYDDVFTASEVLSQVLYYQFGPLSMHMRRDVDRNWVQTAATQLRTMLVEACVSADEIGLPVFDYFRPLTQDTHTIGMTAYAQALFFGLSKTPWTPPEDRIGTNVFQQLALSRDFFAATMQAAERVVLVGPWDLSDELSSRLGQPNISHLEVPHHHTWADEEGFGQYPFLHHHVEQRIKALGDLRGVLVLVGAGIYGKQYVRLAKLQGAVALDVGSVFDAWRGKGRPGAADKGNPVHLDKLS
ncbi:hypothetical protein [Oceanicaulis alexandrii]|uniref:GT-D fold domain-containing protein n=1 Tax=Oceanicaulis alexandrii TaxID=153233 RepID=UPI00235523ED|nr:hypothetical protein [Oceanicaulis alexandrii]